MVESITNVNTKLAALESSSGPVLPIDDIQSKEVSKTPALKDSRETGKSFAKEVIDLPKIQELRSLPVLNTATNFVKKNTGRLFKVGGFVGATLSVLTYFLFNLKSLAMLLGIPTAMAFYIAHSLGKSAENDEVGFSTNPHEILQETINKPGLLETHLTLVLQAVEQIKDTKESAPKKQEGIRLIETLNAIVDSKLDQLAGFEDSRTVSLKHELERFKASYDSE